MWRWQSMTWLAEGDIIDEGETTLGRTHPRTHAHTHVVQISCVTRILGSCGNGEQGLLLLYAVVRWLWGGNGEQGGAVYTYAVHSIHRPSLFSVPAPKLSDHSIQRPCIYIPYG